MQLHLLVHEANDKISRAEKIMLSRIANIVKGIAGHDFMLADLMKTLVSIAMPFRQDYKETFVANRIVNNVKDLIGFDYLIGMTVEILPVHPDCLNNTKALRCFWAC